VPVIPAGVLLKTAFPLEKAILNPIADAITLKNQ
jgi:hypothetical protein